MHVYMHGWTIWGGSAASVGGYRVHCSLQSGENCMGSTWRLFLHHQEIPWFVPLGTASWRNNPALTSCMQQEDLMGKIKQLMIKCVQSAKPTTAVHKAVYRLALHLEHRWTLPSRVGLMSLQTNRDTAVQCRSSSLQTNPRWKKVAYVRIAAKWSTSFTDMSITFSQIILKISLTMFDVFAKTHKNQNKTILI